MNNLVGRIFSLADARYRIVDVRRLNGDALVYAEREEGCGNAAQAGPIPKIPGRTAFRYGDIASLLDGRAEAVSRRPR